MAQPSFSDMIVAERERLNQALDDVNSKIASLNDEAKNYRRELQAVDAYERTKSGSSTIVSASTGRAKRGARGETISSLIGKSAGGMTRSQILESLGARGNKAQEGSISNALANLKKASKLNLKNGVYTVA
ncbi:MAG: hypothetical protein ABL866_04165 [Devosia sp.]